MNATTERPLKRSERRALAKRAGVNWKDVPSGLTTPIKTGQDEIDSNEQEKQRLEKRQLERQQWWEERERKLAEKRSQPLSKEVLDRLAELGVSEEYYRSNCSEHVAVNF